MKGNFELMQKIVKEYLAAHERAIKEINNNIKNTNDRLDSKYI